LHEVGSTGAQAIHQIVIERMKELIEHAPKDDGISVLYASQENPASLSNSPSVESVY